MTFTQRKQLFHDTNELKKYYFEPGYVYTMSFYSHMFHAPSYSLHMYRMKWGIHSYIPGPMQINAIIFHDSNNVISSCDDIIKDTKVNSTLIDEIVKEKSAEIETANNNNNNINKNNNNNKSDEKSISNVVNKKKIDNIEDTDTQDIDSDIASGGRSRNPAVNDVKDPSNVKNDNTTNDTNINDSDTSNDEKNDFNNGMFI